MVFVGGGGGGGGSGGGVVGDGRISHAFRLYKVAVGTNLPKDTF